MNSSTSAGSSSKPETPFLGLAPFLRMSIAGTDSLPVAQELLARAQRDPDDANLWMNLSTALLSRGQRDVGLTIQNQALAMQRVYHLAATHQPAKVRLLMLVVPGDLSANTPLDCLLEDSDIDLDFYFVSPSTIWTSPIPEHDALIVAISEADENRDLLAALTEALAQWPRPVINAPQHIPAVGRELASRLLSDEPGVLIPATYRVNRSDLEGVAGTTVPLSRLCQGCDFPIILRPVGSHGGHGLDKVSVAEAVTAYLASVEGQEFFVSPFVDYRSQDGLYRKIRVAMIDGEAYACHVGISSHWMIHYVNAGMYEDAAKRSEEAGFMEHFADFVQRHRSALAGICQRTQLDYVCIDCAETPDGQLLVFEIDHAMVVHAMDPQDMFPYKQAQMCKVKDAFRNFLIRLTAGR